MLSAFEASSHRLNVAYQSLLSLREGAVDVQAHTVAASLSAALEELMSQPAPTIPALLAKLIEFAIWAEQMGVIDARAVRPLAEDAIRLLPDAFAA